MTNVPRIGESERTRTSVPSSGQVEVHAERQLVQRAQAGDASAYEGLVRMHQRRLLAVVGGILRGSQDVEDVAQQVLLKAYLALKRFDLRAAFGTWLYKIAVNECRDHIRKKKVRRLVYEADLSEEQVRQMETAPDPHVSTLGGNSNPGRGVEQRDLLDRLLGELDVQDRTMLVMKELGGFTVGEIGEILGLNANTVKVRLFRARERLVDKYRRRLKDRTAMRTPRL